MNAPAAGGWVSGDLAIGPARIGVGLDLLVTPGPYHWALTGNRVARARPVPHVAVGLRQVQLTAGFLFPYHPAVGIHLRLPVGLVELRGAGWAGAAGDRERADGTTYTALPVYTLSAGAGVRF